MDNSPRLAQISDKKDVLNFCKNTFSWGDYIHEVWDNWITEGNLIVVENEEIPISMAHAGFYPMEKMIWIEGIRVSEDFRKKGIAEKMINHFEINAKSQEFEISRMLIASENIPSLTLAKKLGYEIISQWNYYSLESKQISPQNIDMSNSCLDECKELDAQNHHFVESWRWIPLTNERINKLNSENKIFCQKINNKTIALGIITESESFENTIILEILSGIEPENMIKFVQNLAYEKNYSKIRILTELESLPQIKNLENKFPFYLMQKKL
ncbi:GNAT family N-acetyltransferase [Candidatus Nitrosopelagicus sp.]|nr:GNAT family N-acetyltransferase [Candidatus Nitrosopelagicus sp.]